MKSPTGIDEEHENNHVKEKSCKKPRIESKPESESFVDDDSENEALDIPEDFPCDYVAIPDEVIEISFEKDSWMKPTFTHQVFPKKRILGYKGLNIRISYTQKWRGLIKVSYEEKLQNFDDVIDHDLEKFIMNTPVNPSFGGETLFTSDMGVFQKWLEEDLSNDISLTPEKIQDNIQFYTSLHATDTGQGLLCRLQAVSIWWIETSEQTDATDERFSLVILYEDHYIKAFTTTFKFLNPFHKRQETTRICQCLVLPQFQKRGFARKMLEFLYKQAMDDDNVEEVNVEDPCMQFVLLRDSVEVTKCLKYAVFSVSEGYSFPSGVVSAECSRSTHEELKISEKQVQRCYEIMRMAYILKSQDKESEAYRIFRLDVKRRLFSEDVEGVQSRPKEELKKNLDLLFQDLVHQYEAVVSRLPPTLTNSL